MTLLDQGDGWNVQGWDMATAYIGRVEKPFTITIKVLTSNNSMPKLPNRGKFSSDFSEKNRIVGAFMQGGELLLRIMR